MSQVHVVEDLERAREKVVGELYEGKPHVRFDVAGDGNLDEKSKVPSPDPNIGQPASYTPRVPEGGIGGSSVSLVVRRRLEAG